MSNQHPVARTPVGRVLQSTRGRSRSLGTSTEAPSADNVQGWLREQVDESRKLLETLTNPPETLAQELADVDEARRQLQLILGKAKLDAADVGAAQAGVERVVRAIEAATDAVARRQAAAALDIRRELGQRVPDAVLQEATEDELQPITAVTRQIEQRLQPLSNLGIDEAKAMLERLPALVETCRRAMADRHSAQAQVIREGLRSRLADERLREATAGERKAVDAASQAVESQLGTLSGPSLAAARNLLDGLPALIEACKKAIDQRLGARARLVRDAIGPKAALGVDPDGVLAHHGQALDRLRKRIRELLAALPLSTANVEEAEHDQAALSRLHGEARQAVADLGGAANGKKLRQAFPDADRLEGFVAECLGGQHKLLGKLLVEGCGGDARRLKSFGDAFADAGSRQRLGRLLSSGGLAANPDALAALLRVGCGGDAGQFKALTERLTDADDPTVETEGLKNLHKVITAGGLGDHPEVLGHLLKTGCPGKPEDGAWDFEKFCAEFGKSPADLAKLLTTGGFAKKATPPPVFPEAMATMLATGCDGDAAKLRDLARSPDIAKVKGLLEGGGLGQHPDALAHAYKLGCDGDPAELAALHDAFEGSGPPKLGRLKAMLEQGNLRQRPEMLGEILGTGCGKRPGKLKDMAVAFTGKLDQLDEMVSAWGPDAGKNIRALTGSRHLADDFAKLQSKFTKSLRQNIHRADDRRRLLQEAPKFTRVEVTTPQALNASLQTPFALNDPALSDFQATDCDYLIAHVCERHLQTHFAFKGAKAAATPIDHSNTQFAADWTPQAIADLLKAALRSGDGQAKLNEIKQDLAAWAQARARFKATQDYADFRRLYPTDADWRAHRDAHQDYPSVHRMARPAVASESEPTKEQMYTAYDHNRATWKGKVPEAPPVVWPNHAKKHVPPRAFMNDPGVHPDPGAPPRPQRDFVHDRFTFRVGVVREQKRMKITQLFPTRSDPPDLLKEFRKYEMEALRDGMVP
jgi:hypothetical protein